MNRPGIAKEYMETKYNCAQSIIKTYANEIGYSENELIHLAFPFGGGCGLQGYICGALSGAAMILGAKYGKEYQGMEEYRDRLYGITQELFEQFKRKQGTILCKELIHYDLSKAEELLEARRIGIFRTKCPEFVYQTAEILEKILNRNNL
jgi:C_GCAxxG_C_C family probable redox protein